MARVIKKENPLREKYDKLKKTIAACFSIAGVCFLLFLLNMYRMLGLDLSFNMILMLPMGISLMVGVALLNKKNSIGSGLEGEEATAWLLSQLPDSYTCYQNLSVSYQDKKSELDLVVTGPTGIFIVEVKNLNGTVHGSYCQDQWRQDKIGQKGGEYSKSFYSPIKQVGTHTWRLANWLRDRQIFTYVNSMVYFSNRGTPVYLSGSPDKIPVYAAFKGEESQLIQRILNNNTQLTSGALNRINQALEQL